MAGGWTGGRRALTAAAAVAVLALSAACSGDGPAAEADPSGSPGTSGTGSTATPTIEENHTVPSPGPRQPGVVAPADIQVVGAKTLDPAKVAAVAALRGVTTMQLALSESTIENKSYSVAAVDPGAYRTFTPLKFADFQDAWDRVAGGELALKERLTKQVPTDADGYLRLGTATDAPAVHVGAYVQQQPLVDIVVNESWVKTLGMASDNALLVRLSLIHIPSPRDGLLSRMPSSA